MRQQERRMRGLSRAAAAALMIAVAPSASAAGWKPLVVPGPGDSTVQPGIARTSDSVLHILWPRPNADAAFADLVHVAVPPSGLAGPLTPDVVLSHWSSIGTPDLAVTAGGLLASFAGYKGGGTSTSLSTASSADAGKSWAVDETKLDSQHPVDEPALTLAGDGTPLFAYGSMFVHRGLTPGGTNTDFQATLGAPAPACCGYDPDIVTDATGAAVWLQWYSSAAGALGIWAERVDPATGGSAGAPVRMPGSVVTFEGKPASTEPFGRAAIAARIGGTEVFGVGAGGYPTRNKALIWRLGGDGSTLLSRRFGRRDPIRAMTVAAASGGRMWALWSTGFGDSLRIHARRSNPAVTRWGAEQALRGPSGSADGQTLDGNEIGGALDVVGRFSFLDAARAGTPYLTRILPALTLVITASEVRRGKPAELEFSVTDAGAPVRGVRVAVAQRNGRDYLSSATNSRGRATVTVTLNGPAKISTRSAAYATAREVVRPR